MKILVVDDDKDWRGEIAGYLRDEVGHEVFETGGVRETKEFLKKTVDRLDYFVTDGLEGEWKQIVSLAKERQIPIVVLTNNSAILEEIRTARGDESPLDLISINKINWVKNNEILSEAISFHGGQREREIG